MDVETAEASFLDRVYAAPLASEGWVPVLEGLADMVGGSSAWLARHHRGHLLDGCVARMDDAVQPLYLTHFASADPLSIRSSTARGRLPPVFTDDQRVAKSTLVQSAFYNDFMRVADSHSVLMIDLGETDGIHTAIHVNRPADRPRYGRRDIAVAERLLPHLARAARLSVGVAGLTERAVGPIAALDTLETAILLVDGDSRLLHVNTAGETLLRGGSGLGVSGGCLSAAGSLAPGLGAMIAAAAHADPAARRSGSMAIRCPSGETLHLTATPLSGERSARLACDRAKVLLSVSNPARANPASGAGTRLRDLFGLTAAEQRVTLALVEGLTPREAAERLGTQVTTIRNQLRSIFAKTGARGQSDLVRLVLPLNAG